MLIWLNNLFTSSKLLTTLRLYALELSVLYELAEPGGRGTKNGDNGKSFNRTN